MLWAEVYEMARLSCGLPAVAGLFRKKIGFKVSCKSSTGKMCYNLMIPQILVCAANLAAIVFAVLRLTFDLPAANAHKFPLWVEGIQIAFCAYYFVLSISFFALVKRTSRPSEKNFLHPVKLPIRIGGKDGAWVWTQEISIDKAVLTSKLNQSVKFQDGDMIEIFIPEGVVRVAAEMQDDGRKLCFSWPDAKTCDDLDQALHAGRWHKTLSGKSELAATYAERLNLVPGFNTKNQQVKMPWVPVVSEGLESGNLRLAFARMRKSYKAGEIIRFDGQTESVRIVTATQRGLKDFLFVDVATPRSHMMDENAIEGIGGKRWSVRTIDIKQVKFPFLVEEPKLAVSKRKPTRKRSIQPDPHIEMGRPA